MDIKTIRTKEEYRIEFEGRVYLLYGFFNESKDIYEFKVTITWDNLKDRDFLKGDISRNLEMYVDYSFTQYFCQECLECQHSILTKAFELGAEWFFNEG